MNYFLLAFTKQDSSCKKDEDQVGGLMSSRAIENLRLCYKEALRPAWTKRFQAVQEVVEEARREGVDQNNPRTASLFHHLYGGRIDRINDRFYEKTHLIRKVFEKHRTFLES